MRASFIEPGVFRTEMALMQVTRLADGAGGHLEDWVEVASFLAHLEPAAPQAFFGADQRMERVTHRATMRWRGDVRPGMRLGRQGRRFRILTAHDPDETGRYLVCAIQEEIS